MDLIPIECGNCKAKLKIKASSSRMPTEVKCPKCGKSIPLAKPQGSPSAPAPAASPATPPPAAPVAAAPVAAPVPPPPPPVASPSETAQLTPPPKPASSSPTPASTPAAPAGARKAAAPIVLGQLSDAASTTTIPATCPNCQWQTKVSPALSGKKIRCKQCSGVIQVAFPEHSTVAAPEAAPVPTPTPATDVTPVPPPPPVSGLPASVPEASVSSDESADLRAKLDAALRNAAMLLQKLNAAELQVKTAETRAQEAETALHDIAGKRTVEGITTNRKIADLETRVAELTARLAALVEDDRTELELTEKRVTALRGKIAHYSH